MNHVGEVKWFLDQDRQTNLSSHRVHLSRMEKDFPGRFQQFIRADTNS